jgi:hypothetical protein
MVYITLNFETHAMLQVGAKYTTKWQIHAFHNSVYPNYVLIFLNINLPPISI